MLFSKQKLINMASPDANIHDLQTLYPKAYRAIKNLGDSSKILINLALPPFPAPNFAARFVLVGNPSVANDVLTYRYHVILPDDSNDNWNYTRIDLSSCYITAKVQGATNPLSVDIKVSQNKGNAAFISLFKTGFNPILPKLTTSAHNVDFQVGSLFDDDLLRVDVLATDGTVSDISLDLIGNYVLEEKN